MSRTEERRPGWGTEAAEKSTKGDGLASSIARVVDIECYRRRRACRRAELHLRERGLWGSLSARVLADLAGEVGA